LCYCGDIVDHYYLDMTKECFRWWVVILSIITGYCNECNGINEYTMPITHYR